MNRRVMKGRVRSTGPAGRSAVGRVVVAAALGMASGGCSGAATEAAELDTLDSYQRAVSVVARALDAIGGPGAIERAGGLTVEAEGYHDLGVRLQGQVPRAGERHNVYEALGWIPAEDRLVYESHGRINSDADEWMRHDHRSDAAYWVDLLSRRAFLSGQEARRRYARTIPHVLLEEALSQRTSLRHVGRVTVAGEGREAVAYLSADGVVLTLLFDPGSGLLMGVDYLADLPLRGDTRVRWSYGPYRPVEGLGRYPSGYTIHLAGERLREMEYVRVTTGPGSGLFDVPSDIALPAPPPPTPTAPASVEGDTAEGEAEASYDIRELAPGVHLFVSLRPGFHMLFVEFDEFVLAVDAPSTWYELHQLPAQAVTSDTRSTALGERYLAGIRSRVDKPVRYVVLTHHHSDHAGGILPFIEAGATVLGTEPTRRAVERAVAGTTTLARMSARPRPELSFETVREERILSDDSMEVRLVAVGPNPHAEGMLAVHLPRHRLTYVSDLFEPSGSSHFPSPARVPVMRWFVEWLDASGLESERIFAVHGSARVTDDQIERIRSLGDRP